MALLAYEVLVVNKLDEQEVLLYSLYLLGSG